MGILRDVESGTRRVEMGKMADSVMGVAAGAVGSEMGCGWGMAATYAATALTTMRARILSVFSKRCEQEQIDAIDATFSVLLLSFRSTKCRRASVSVKRSISLRCRHPDYDHQEPLSRTGIRV